MATHHTSPGHVFSLESFVVLDRCGKSTFRPLPFVVFPRPLDALVPLSFRVLGSGTDNYLSIFHGPTENQKMKSEGREENDFFFFISKFSAAALVSFSLPPALLLLHLLSGH